MASSIVLKLACLVLVCTVAIAPLATADVSCGQVVNDLTPCINYVSNGGTVPENCCNGVKALYQAAQTTADRQSVCKCLKNAISGIPYTNYNLGLAAGLPSKCGVNLPYKISPSTDCSSVN
ncbi:non-specific lipid-transfer protein 3-like [Pistacia vera]|uniref:non-specific lipid-transfer protein 3-like n=1 Tax=Pistacia vera TaxID=55513 RepID=UPI001263B5BD|nr:non-specific lipid-transfer protein 3-like [Pistacia vera]